jgi:hypothetical protein
MGKNKLSSGLINVVTYDTDSNISLNSGSNLLMSLSGSGTVTIPGNLVVLGGISGSTAESASYSLNADKIDNLDSTQLVLTSSFNSYTSSASSSLGSLSGSIATTTLNLSSSVSSSIGDLSGSIATTTSGLSSTIGSLSSSVATTTSNLSSSIATTTSGLGLRITTIEGNYATTGSNIFVGSQVITGSLYITNDMVVQGCSCLQNITASAVSIGTNTVVLNTATPAVRFAGISVQDSGSNAGVTGSIFWDGLCNKWVYSNPSGVGYSGGMLLSGPRTSTLGSESPLTCNYIAKSGGGDHLYDSCIIDDGTTVCVNANLKGSGTISGTNIYASTVTCSPVGKFTSCIEAGGGTFSGAISGTSATFTNNVNITNTGGAMALSFKRTDSPVGTGAIYFKDSCDNIDASISHNVTIGAGLEFGTCGTNRMYITNDGNIGIGTTSPNTKLEVKGSIRLDSRSKVDTGEIDSITFTKDRPDASTGTYEMGAIRSFTYGGYAGGLTFYSGRHTGNGNYGLISVMTIGSTSDIGAPNLGIGTTSPRTRLQVTPTSNAEVPVLGCASGVAIFTSTNTNYGLQFNSTSDGSFHIQSQRFDNSATAYSLVLQPAGGTVAINGNSSQAALHIGEADTRKISYIGNHSIRRTNLFKTFNQGSTTDYWARISLNNSYADSTQGVYGTITVAWHPFHASMGRFYQYRFFQAPYGTNNSYMKIQTVFEEVFGWDYYGFSSDVTFYNYQSYLYIKITGSNANYAWARSIQAELTGGSYAMDNVNLEVGVSAPAGLSGIITKNGSAVLSG